MEVSKELAMARSTLRLTLVWLFSMLLMWDVFQLTISARLSCVRPLRRRSDLIFIPSFA